MKLLYSFLLLFFILLIMFSCKTVNLELISNEVTDKYIQEVYGKYTKFEVKELSENNLKSVKRRLVVDYELFTKDFNNEKKFEDIVENELIFSDNQYYALIIISHRLYSYNELNIKMELFDNENNIIPGKIFITYDFTSLIEQGICKYYFVYKAEKPIDQNIIAKLVIQFPKGKIQIYKISSPNS